jgi:(p)ppGpp synthase/HD superfamily hydrolase
MIPALSNLRRVADLFHGQQRYGDHSYLVHLEEVRDVLSRFGFTPERAPILHQAAYLHDLFEDTPLTPDEAIHLGAHPDAVQTALLVTDEEGATRKERKLKTYQKTKTDPIAVILKLADRIANVEAGGKIDMYKKEHADFAFHLGGTPSTEEMWKHLNGLLK